MWTSDWGAPNVKLIAQWLIGILAVAVAAWVVPGISVRGEEWVGIAITAIILGLVNTFVRPAITLLTLPITILTLGLFMFVIGGIALVLASWLSLQIFGAGLVIDGFLAAILGALVIGIISGVLGSLVSGA
jgi:putative membrane protein